MRAPCGHRCPNPRKKPWDEVFKEHAAAYAAYKSSDAYVEPEKKHTRKINEYFAPVQKHKNGQGTPTVAS